MKATTFSTFYSSCANLEAEAWALLEALQVCMTLGYMKVLVEMDSKFLLDVVLCQAACP